MCCSQSERGGLRCANAEVQSQKGRGDVAFKELLRTLYNIGKHREEGGKLHLIIFFSNAGVSGKRGSI